MIKRNSVIQHLTSYVSYTDLFTSALSKLVTCEKPNADCFKALFAGTEVLQPQRLAPTIK